MSAPRGTVLPADWTTRSVRRLNCELEPGGGGGGGGGKCFERQPVWRSWKSTSLSDFTVGKVFSGGKKNMQSARSI